MEEYTVDANKALKIQLCRSPDATKVLSPEETGFVEPFQPEFTYPIFGDAETIYGYSQDLVISLQLASGSLATCLSISYKDQLPATSNVKPDDIEGKLYEKLAADYLKDKSTFEQRVIADEASFKPLGTRIGAYGRKLVKPDAKGKGRAPLNKTNDNDTPRWVECDPEDKDAVVYEAWATTMATPGFREYHRRMQPFVLLYIEGGSYIEEEDVKWEFVTLYEKRKSSKGTPTYHFVGYSSLYPFFNYPNKIRMRLSQFVILPPFQGSGHGAHLYSIIYFWLLTREDINELAVEDPSEAFQDLRDKIDLGVLLAQDAILTMPLDKEWIAETRQAMKLGQRQFGRILEMAIMLKLGDAAKDSVEFRLLVKERLYRFSALCKLLCVICVSSDNSLHHMQDKISQLDPAERKEMLQKTFESVMADYERLTEKFAEHLNSQLDDIGEQDEEEDE